MEVGGRGRGKGGGRDGRGELWRESQWPTKSSVQ